MFTCASSRPVGFSRSGTLCISLSPLAPRGKEPCLPRIPVSLGKHVFQGKTMDLEEGGSSRQRPGLELSSCGSGQAQLRELGLGTWKASSGVFFLRLGWPWPEGQQGLWMPGVMSRVHGRAFVRSAVCRHCPGLRGEWGSWAAASSIAKPPAGGRHRRSPLCC